MVEQIINDEDVQNRFKKAQSISLDDALEVIFDRIRRSRQNNHENNPIPFFLNRFDAG
jgi:hypothetical protein